MGQKLTYAPVYFVLGQVRFNTLLTVDQHVPAIQDSLRKAGYPDFQRGVTLNMNFAPGPGQMPSLEQLPRFQFLNAERTAGFILEQAGMSFQTTDYDTFEPFLAALLLGLDIVHATTPLSYSERIGIRYLDAVSPNAGDKLEQYLSPTVTGLMTALTGKRELVQSVSETRSKEGNTGLLSRAIIYEQENEGVAFPPELQPIILNVTDRFKKIKGLYAIIDTDSWLEERQPFDISNLEKQLRVLKDNIGFSFDLMVTDYARDCWK